MSEIYGRKRRNLQEQFETRKMADRLEAIISKTELDGMDKGFVSSRDRFFLSSIVHQGRPLVSYKRGDPGFVSIIDARNMAFPRYNGNATIDTLFIDFKNPNRTGRRVAKPDGRE